MGEFSRFKKNVRRGARDVASVTVDPVAEEANRINDKIAAETARIPNNIDKGLDKAEAAIGSAIDTAKGLVGDVTGLLPGAGAIKFIGIAIGALILLSVLRKR